MRIVHVIQTLDPATGGPAAVVARLAAAQAALGHEVAVASYADDDQRRRIEQAVAHVPGMDRCRRIDLGAAAGLERWTARRARSALGTWLQSRPDVMHLHGVWEPLLLRAARLGRRHDVPYVVRPCGMLDPWSLRQRAFKKRLALALAYRAMLDAAAFLHALNADEARLVAPLNLRCPVHIIPNGVFLDEVRPLPAKREFRDTIRTGADADAALNALGDHPYMLFLSRLHHKKGLDILAEAFALAAPRMPQVHLVVAGPEEGAGNDFRARIAAAGLTSRVHVIGALYGRRKLAALVDAACFVLPSRQEGFSVAVLEALACGTPAIISDACHFPEVQQHGAGRVTPLEAGVIAAAMGEVLGDAALRQRMGAAGLALVEANYTWPQIAQRTLAQYPRRG